MPYEATIILGIPLSQRYPLDKIAWAYSPSGLFSTSSAYKLLVAWDAINQAGSSTIETQKHFWKGVWRLRVPNKIKYFIWRACNDDLPTMSNLYHRQITLSDKCELYQLCPEDPLHDLWSSKDVEKVWSSFHCFHQSCSPPPMNFSDLLSRFLQVQEDYRKEVFAISAWLLWNRRNAIHFGRPVHPTANIVSLAGNMLQDFQVAQDLDSVVYYPPILQQ